MISNPVLKCLVDEDVIFEIAHSIKFELKNYLSAKNSWEEILELNEFYLSKVIQSLALISSNYCDREEIIFKTTTEISIK